MDMKKEKDSSLSAPSLQKNMNPKNPYTALIEREAENLLAHSPESLMKEFLLNNKKSMRHISVDSEWKYTRFANWLCIIAYMTRAKEKVWNKTKLASAHTMIFFLFTLLLNASKEDRWYHNQPGKGDSNIDRFVLLPFIEAYLMVKKSLPKALASKIENKIKGVLDLQIEEYGKKKPSPAPNKDIFLCRKGRTGYYPNMDVYYALFMYLGWKITKQPSYKKEFQQILRYLEKAQFPDGGWTYIKGTNECPAYHDIIVIVLARLWQVSQDKTVIDMLQKSASYYPLLLGQSLTPEYYTDPWWKHYWRPQSPQGPDIVASVTGDRYNRWIGNRLPRSAKKKDGLLSLYTALLWKPVKEKSYAKERIVYDANIEGPRGQFKNWSWAATARYGSDTIVGALVHTHNQDIIGVLGILPEIKAEKRRLLHAKQDSIGITPKGTKGITSITKKGCSFDVSYQMAHFRSIWEVEPFPWLWKCRQQWEMNKDSLHGIITVTSLATQSSPSPWIRIRFGKEKSLLRINKKLFSYGPLQLKIGKSDFDKIKIRQAPAFPYAIRNDSTDIILYTKEKTDHVKGAIFAIEISILFAASPQK
ncbi:MAG: hypothetical protein WDA18_09615 [Candidatus Ratteibacteria bacterium]